MKTKLNAPADRLAKLLLISLLSANTVQAGAAEQTTAGEADSKTAVMAVPVEFTVVFDEPVDAHYAWKDGAVVGHLKSELKLNGKVAATSGALVKGHVEPLDRKGKVIEREDLRGKRFAKNSPFKVVFDEIVAGSPSKAHVLKLHAVPSNQCSMINTGTAFHTIEVTTGGVVITASGIEADGSIQLQAGDELVVRISQDKTSPNGGLAKVDESSPAVKGTGTSKSPVVALALSPSAALKLQASPAPAKAKKEKALAEPTSTSVDLANESDTGSAASAANTSGSANSGTSVATEPLKQAPPATDDAIPAPASPNKTSLTDAVPAISDSSKLRIAVAVKPKGDADTSVDNEEASNPSDATATATPEKPIEAKKTQAKSKEFRVAFRAPLFTQTARVGDRAKAVLLDDMKVKGEVIAKAGSLIQGHVVAIRHSCRWGGAVMANNGRFQRNANLKVEFNKIITADGKQIGIEGTAPLQNSVFNNEGLFKRLTVAEGGVTVEDQAVENNDQTMTDLSKNIMKLGATAIMGPAAAIAMPLVVAGAITRAQPAVAHSINKTFIAKGNEIYIAPGDEMFIEARLCDSNKDEKAVSARILSQGKKHNKSIQTAASKNVTTQ